MQEKQTDNDWEYFGKTDPYWAVVTNEKFHRENFNDKAKDFFFQTGEEYIAHMFEIIRSHIDADFKPERALDFGSGVGRLVVPLSGRCSEVVGVDVSDSMLKEAERVVGERKLPNISFVKGDDGLSRVEGCFDFINSYIVLQHIPVERGEKILHRLLDLLNDGGVGVLHFTYSRSGESPVEAVPGTRLLSRWKGALRKNVGKLYRFCRRMSDKMRPGGNRNNDADISASPPSMQMNKYNLNYVLHQLQEAGVRRVHMEFTDHSGTYGTILFFQRTSAADRGHNF